MDSKIKIKAPMRTSGLRRSRLHLSRKGAATIDYFLLLAVIIPLAAFMTFAVPRIIRLVYELLITMVDMPFM